MGVCDYSCFFHSEEGEQCLELHKTCGKNHDEEEGYGSNYAYLVIFNSVGDKLPSKLINKRIERVEYDWDSFQFDGYREEDDEDGYADILVHDSGLEYPNSFWKHKGEYIINLCPTCFHILRNNKMVKCKKYIQSVESKHGKFKDALKKYRYLV